MVLVIAPHQNDRNRHWTMKSFRSYFGQLACLFFSLSLLSRVIMMWGVFCWCLYGLLVKLESILITVTCTTIVEEHFHPFMFERFLSGDGLFQWNNGRYSVFFVSLLVCLSQYIRVPMSLSYWKLYQPSFHQMHY